MKNYNFVSVNEAGVLMNIIYPETLSENFIPKVEDLSEGGSWIERFPPMELRMIPRARVTGGSDIVTFQGMVVLEKATNPLAGKTIFRDSNLVGIDLANKNVSVQETPTLDVIECGYSMLGVFAGHWGHFIMERIPALLTAIPHLPRNSKILIPQGLDEIQLKLLLEIFEMYQRDLDVLVVPNGSSVNVDELFCCRLPCRITNDAKWIFNYDVAFPSYASREMQKIRSYLNPTEGQGGKVFITRRNTGARITSNILEIEDFMARSGYVIFNPDDCDFEERRAVFAGCDEIVAISGSAALNAIFCPKISSAILVTPLVRCLDQGLQNLFRPEKFKYVLADSSDDGIHPNIEISISRLSAALASG